MIKRGMTALLWAIKNGEAECVQTLLEAGADINKRCKATAQGALTAHQTPLMMACVFDRPEIVQILIAQGADLRLKDKAHKTARSYAASDDVRQMLDTALDEIVRAEAMAQDARANEFYREKLGKMRRGFKPKGRNAP